MDTSRQVIIWTAGAAGVMLIYSAYKNQSPLTELKSWLGGGGSGVSSGSGQASSAPGADPGTATNTGDLPSTVTAEQNQAEINNVLSGGGQASGYTVGTDSTGIAYVYDQNGNMVSEVPSAYQHSPGTYIPPRNVAGSAY